MEVSQIKKRITIPLRDSERKAIILFFDLVAINFALFFALTFRPEYSLNFKLFLQKPQWFLLLSFLWLIAAHVFDLYDMLVAANIHLSLSSIIKASFVTCGIFLIIPYLTPGLPTLRRYIMPFFFFTIFFVIILRGVYILATSGSLFQRKALIIGTGWEALAIAKAIKEAGSNAYEIVGRVRVGKHEDAPEQKQKSMMEENFAPILGKLDDLRRLIEEYRIATIILAYSGEVDGVLLDGLTGCMELGVDVVPMPILYERLTGRVPVEHVGSNWYVAMPVLHPGTGTLWPLVKRTTDLILASLGLVFLAIVAPFIALAIYVESPGPIFYVQERVGKGGRRFKAIKFRSMKPDAEKGKAVWAEKNDPRVTRVGKLLRKTHLDEFPQFINILKGEMSVVGPRAERPEFVEELRQEIPFYCVRHAVRPGMAGWGLVKQGYGASKEDALIKLQYDLYYIKHQSLWLDLIILIKTFLNALTFRGR